jgi:phosphatidate cytidylyltransferase
MTSMISNPFANPLFPQVAWTALGLLTVTLVVLLAVARFNLERLRESVLFARWKVWVVVAPVYGLSLLAGALPATLLLMALTFQGLREYAALVGLPRTYRRVLLVAGMAAAPAALISVEVFYALPAVALLVGTLQPLLFTWQRDGVRHLAFAALGWGYIAWFLAHLVLVYRYVEGGPGILLALGLAVALSDVCAFTVGKVFGKHKLAPTISPNKTWEGVAGNLVGALAGLLLMGFALPDDSRLLLLAVLPFVIGFGAVWGDLVESGIKREFGAKDAGGWLPGFGGLLDRIDSLILVVPLATYALRAIA